jgi:hypothetical protein
MLPNESSRHLDSDGEGYICSQGVLDVMGYEVFEGVPIA